MNNHEVDTNLTSAGLLKRIRKFKPELKVMELESPLKYRCVSGKVYVTCTRNVNLDVHLKIRHGTNLIFRNIIWKVYEEDIEIRISGRSHWVQ